MGDFYEEIGALIDDLAGRRDCFFLRLKSNHEWEAGYGQAGGSDTERAETALAALRALDQRGFYCESVNPHNTD